jgi:hypothetical protein
MIHFGVTTLLRHQFPGPTLEEFLTPLSDLRADEMLWAWMGWSWVYTIFLGAASVLTGAFLLFRRTALLGTLCAGIVLSNVVLLNFLFDVPEKSLSPHFTVMMSVLLLPDAIRLLDVHITGRAVAPADLARDVPGGWFAANRRLLKPIVVAAMCLSPVLLVQHARGHLLPPAAHPMSGRYAIRSFIRNREVILPVLGDSARWDSAVITSDGSSLHVQRMDRSWVVYDLQVDSIARRITLADPRRAADWRLRELTPMNDPPLDFEYTSRTRDVMHLIGGASGDSIDIVAERVDRRRFVLLGRLGTGS